MNSKLGCLGLAPICIGACDDDRPAGARAPDSGRDTAPDLIAQRADVLDGGAAAPPRGASAPDGAAGERPTPTPDAAPAPVDARPAAAADARAAGPISWAGRYDAMGVWDLSGPITARRTLGDVVTDLLIEEIVSRAGVPSLVEDRARDAVGALIGARVKALVDASAPAALRPDSDLVKKLALVLASTDVASTLDLMEPTPGTVRGTEELRSFTFGFEGARSTLGVGELLDRSSSLVTLGAEWKGKEVGADGLAIEPHTFELRLGKLIPWVADNVLRDQGAPSLSQTAASVLDCAAIVGAVLDGKDRLTFGVGVASYTVSLAGIQGACAATTGMGKDRALGLFDVDGGVSLGGEVQYLDESGDAIADRLRSKAGYGGVVTRTRASLAPRVAARFEALRRAP